MSPNEENKQITLADIDKTADNAELIAKWVEFFRSIGFTIADDREPWETFIKENSHTLYIEAQYFGMNKNNPFFKFLAAYVPVGTNSIADLTRLYGTLHNLVARGSISEKQVAFTCPEKEQIRILLNRTLYHNCQNNENDFCYLIKCYNWLLSIDIKRDVKNKFIVDNFTNKQTDKVQLIRCIFFTKALTTFMESDKTDQDETIFIGELKKNIDSNFLISAQLMPCDDIEKNMNWLNQNVQESGRTINGKGQKADVDLKKQNGKQNDTPYVSPGEKQIIVNKMKPALDQAVKAANISGVESTADFVKLIKRFL